MTPGLSLQFSLTEEEIRVAASRAAWRASLADGLVARHLAPLAAFALVVAFAAILGWTGLVARRAAEIALIAAAAAYMIYRLWTRRRFLAARRTADAWASTISGPLRLAIGETEFLLAAEGAARRWRFDEGLEIEEIAGLVYVWPRRGAPLVWPSRAHSDPQAAAQFLSAARVRIGARPSAPAAPPDDDDD